MGGPPPLETVNPPDIASAIEGRAKKRVSAPLTARKPPIEHPIAPAPTITYLGFSFITADNNIATTAGKIDAEMPRKREKWSLDFNI
jgi:hypothetical protein